MQKSLALIGIMIILLIGGVVAAITFSANQNVTVTLPFSVQVTSSNNGVTCSSGTTITCTGISLPVGGEENLTATFTYNSQTSVTYIASSANISVATISPTGPATVSAPTTSQKFTVTGVGQGSTSVSLSFS